jgi:hypothetical protein
MRAFETAIDCAGAKLFQEDSAVKARNALYLIVLFSFPLLSLLLFHFHVTSLVQSFHPPKLYLNFDCLACREMHLKPRALAMELATSDQSQGEWCEDR